MLVNEDGKDTNRRIVHYSSNGYPLSPPPLPPNIGAAFVAEDEQRLTSKSSSALTEKERERERDAHHKRARYTLSVLILILN
jgi:hypothetical protein